MYYNNIETFNEHNQRCITTLHTVKITLGANHVVNDAKIVGNKREIIYYANSNNIMSDISYVDDKREGLTMKWYDNSQHSLKSEQHYVNGKRHGQWLTFDVNGNITSDITYDNGVKQS